MPRIKLKPNSPEYADSDTKPHTVRCDMPGCNDWAEHKAPKHRGLNEYYTFCFDHVRDYNKAWNFFSGMAEREVEEHIYNSMFGDRPTWRYDQDSNLEDDLKRKAWQSYHATEKEPPKKEHAKRSFAGDRNTPEYEAMAILGVEPPIGLSEIKTRYRELAKKHHPDLNGGCEKSEELLKRVNMAYTILKLAYQQFEELPERP